MPLGAGYLTRVIGAGGDMQEAAGGMALGSPTCIVTGTP